MNILNFLSDILLNKDKLLEEKEDQDTGISVKTYEGGDQKACPYYTELSHPEFNDGGPLVIDQYFSEDDAIRGHHRLVLIFVLGIIKPDSVDVFFNRSLGIRSDTKIQTGICLNRNIQIH